jgi:tRNA nucleotidyltransferase (CCA-adding enzyme)
VKVYQVGGAVRDKFLDYPAKDHDYLVTGATIDQMLELGFQQVGKSFPVFLHPESKEEYALARTEKKQGHGYTGFTVDFSPSITLEEDLARRDLTVNAMALDEDGNLHDPFNGKQDLDSRILRHVSDAFIEDPLRVLRVAKFAARYHHLGFSIAPETFALMKRMVADGEVDHLVAERVWQEMESSLTTESPQVFFEVLHECGALKVLFSELDALWGVPNPPKWHPEIDSGIHTMMVLEQACILSNDITVRFAALCHDLGKGVTPPEHWPHHHGHETKGLKLIKAVCKRMKVPNEHRDLALLVSEFHTHCHRVFDLKPETVLKVLNRMDAWRKPQRFAQFLDCCRADLRGRTGFENELYPQADFLHAAYEAAAAIPVQDIVRAGFQGADIKVQLHERRTKAIAELKRL